MWFARGVFAEPSAMGSADTMLRYFATGGLVVFLAGLTAIDILLQDRFSVLDWRINSEYFARNDRLECKGK